MSGESRTGIDRRTLLRLTAGVATASGIASFAGCIGDDDEATPTPTPTETPGDGPTPTPTPPPVEVPAGVMQDHYWRDLDEPEDREGYLGRANLAAHQEAPWIFLHQQMSVYGKTTRIDWQARPDEAIHLHDASVQSGSSTVIVTQGQMDSGLDPHDHRETPTDNIVLQSYDKLLDRDRDGNIQPGLATDWERIEDGRARFQIREGVQFHNGDVLEPSDVAYSINRVVDPDVGDLESPQFDQLAGVVGAEVVDGEDAVDVLSDGFNPIVFQEFASYCQIVQEDWFESRSSTEVNSDMNGTGPFRVVDYETDVEVVYESFDDHWRGAPDLDEVIFRGATESSTRVSQLIEGETDIIVNVPPQEVQRIQNESTTEIAAEPSTRIIFNPLRYDVEPFSDPQFRRALNYAIDLDSIIENVLQGFGVATGQPTLQAFFGHNEDIDPYPYDPEYADELIADAGYEGEELTLHTPVGRYLGDFDVAQAVAGYVDDLETVSAEVQQRDFGNLVEELLDGDIETTPPWYLIGWGNTTFDASQTILPLLMSPGSDLGGALSGYSDSEFDDLLRQAQSVE